MMWKTWKRVSRGKYWVAHIPEHPNSNTLGYVLEHRVIMENIVGRLLAKDEIVHHKNKNRKDNNVENLELIKRSEHTSFHNREKGLTMVDLLCPFCGKKFSKRKGKTSLVKNKGKLNFCSRQCSGKFTHLEPFEKQKRGKNNITKEYKIYTSS